MNISRNYNRGKSFRFSTWETGKVYKNDDYVQDFVKYKDTLYACVVPFTTKRPDYILKHPDIRGDWDVVISGGGVNDMIIEYGISFSDDLPDTWFKDIPEVQQGSYFWTRITYVFKDGINEVSYQKTYVPKDGSNSTIGVKLDEDGVYYWTINNEWIVDNNGNKIQANGKDGIDGKDGVDGQDGKDGYTPVVGIQIAEDGEYYWTLDGKWMLDAEENRIKAVGIDGKDGIDAITPKFKIENDFWYISYDNEETWIEMGKAKGDSGKSSTEIAESTDDNKNFIVIENNGEEQAIAVREIDSDKTVLNKPITVAGLSGTLGAGNYKNNDIIPAGTDLYTILQKLLCKEIYPSNIISTAGTFTAKSGISSTTITKSDSLVEPGTTITFTIKQGSVSGYNQTGHSVTGLTYGYSLQNDNSKDGDTTSFSKNWNISKTASDYSLKITGGGKNDTLTGTTPQSGTCSFKATVGTNTCSVVSSGEEIYLGNIEEIPVYYGVSNIGNTDDNYKSKKLEERTNVEVKSSGSSTSTESITCVYPVYHNVSSNTLGSEATVKMSLSTSTKYTISNIPSEESLGKQFIFDFPANASISGVTITPLPSKYKVYSNINGTVIGSTFDKDHGTWTSSMTFDVPKESGSARFAIEYPASVSVKQLLRHNDATGKDDVYSLYKTESVKRGNDSYIRLTMTHDSAQGASLYKITFNTPSSKTSSDYEITSGIIKTINGTTYNYKRLTTTSNEGWVDRSITFNKSLNNV